MYEEEELIGLELGEEEDPLADDIDSDLEPLADDAVGVPEEEEEEAGY
ncbi:hypothetical protein IPF86_01520 [Candidatus Nomurabacteria bacterium]|jgi:hypothetical protein|nr:MAG: hypothetical protein IPF86_01520 [Candidatus Nomurabacteria bacterium]